MVTTTALSGKGRNLEADKGDKYQVEVLSNAEAWVPSKQSEMDFTSFFQSQRVGRSHYCLSQLPGLVKI